MPIRLDEENVSVHALFWNALTANSDSLALSQLWMCGIDRASLTRIANAVNNQLGDYESGSWNTVENGQAAVNSVVLDPGNWTGSSTGAHDLYLFANGISFIADGLNTSRVGPDHVGAMKGLIGDGRLELNAANITFLESNISFVDGLLRPWMALVGHRSLKDQNLRCDIEFYCLEKWTLYQPLKVRKAMKFKNAVPINVDAVEMNYTGDKLIERSVQFAFDRYEVNVFPTLTNEGITSVKLSTQEDSADAQGVQHKDLLSDSPSPEPNINKDQNGEDLKPSPIENPNKSNTSPTPSVNENHYKRDRTFIIPLKNKYKNNSSVAIKIKDKNPLSNASPTPEGELNAVDGVDIITFEDGELNQQDPLPNTEPRVLTQLNANETDFNQIPVSDNNATKPNGSIIPTSNNNTYQPNINPIPTGDIHTYLPNVSLIPMAEIISTGR